MWQASIQQGSDKSTAHSLISRSPCYCQTWEKPVITHQEPDAKLTEEPLVMLVVLLVIKFNIVEGVVGGGEAHLTASVQLKLTLLCVYFCLL